MGRTRALGCQLEIKNSVSSEGSFSSVFLSDGLNRLSLEVFVWNLTSPSSVIEEVVAGRSHSCWTGLWSQTPVLSRWYQHSVVPVLLSTSRFPDDLRPLPRPNIRDSELNELRAAIFSRASEVLQHGSFWNCIFLGCYLGTNRHGK